MRRWGLRAARAVTALYLFWIWALILLKWINPPTTGVQAQRRIESFFTKGRYEKHQRFVPLNRIAPALQHAAISAEDGRFYQHHGIDWEAVRKVAESGRLNRGVSTITQQLVKNLFFTTHRNPVRKIFEYTLAPMADTILGKRRVLELYLNVIEWGPGVFGAEAAAEYHYRRKAEQLHRDQAARLAACLPAPRGRNPSRMNQSSALIQEHMSQVGW
jgi:monofunctional glycosyltransferase